MRPLLAALTCWAALVLAATVASADVPATLTFTARIADAGTSLEGSHALSFRLFDAETGGTARWSEDHESVVVNDGLATVTLGAGTPLTATVIDGAALWIEVTLDGETMSPRLPVRSVPYAVRAGDSERVGGVTAAGLDAAYVNAAGDAMTGSLDLGGDLVLGGKVALRGTDSWLRLNQDGAFTSGIHSPSNLNVGGLTVGALYHHPGAGNLEVAGFGSMAAGGRFNGIALGAAPFGTLAYPYETMQLQPGTNLRISFGSDERLRLASDGRLWMGSNAGDCPSGWFCNGMFWDMSVSSILYSGLSQRSDRRLKKDIHSIEQGLPTVRALRPVSFSWRNPAVPGRQYGFIAQEVQRVVPELVSTTPDGMLALDTQDVLPILVQAVKELDAQNAELRAELDALCDSRPCPPGRAAEAGSWPSRGTLALVLAFGLVGLVLVRRPRR